MTSRPLWAILIAATLLASAGCSSQEPLATPLTPSPAPSVAEPTTPASPESSPSPSPTPLSPFEADPAVRALRAHLVAAAEGINAKDLETPALRATSTARRLSRLPDIYSEEIKTYFPGPRPVAVLGVNVVSAAARDVLACSLEDGFGLDKPGGTPVMPEKVLPVEFEVLLEDGQWKVHAVRSAEGVSCSGVVLPRSTA